MLCTVSLLSRSAVLVTRSVIGGTPADSCAHNRLAKHTVSTLHQAAGASLLRGASTMWLNGMMSTYAHACNTNYHQDNGTALRKLPTAASRVLTRANGGLPRKVEMGINSLKSWNELLMQAARATEDSGCDVNSS
jgi:hypothetical protein